MTVTPEGGEVVIPVHKPAEIEKFFFFLSGMISSVPLTLFVGQFTDALVSSLPILIALLLSSVIFTPFVEEFAKAFPLLYRHGETERSIFTLGLLVGLGFGLVEFILYVFFLGVPLIFRLPGVLFHIGSTSITAYGIATKRAFMFYMIAVSLHFLNNFSALIQFAIDPNAIFGIWTIGAYGVLFTTLYLSYWLHRKTTQKIST